MVSRDYITLAFSKSGGVEIPLAPSGNLVLAECCFKDKAFATTVDGFGYGHNYLLRTILAYETHEHAHTHIRTNSLDRLDCALPGCSAKRSGVSKLSESEVAIRSAIDMAVASPKLQSEFDSFLSELREVVAPRMAAALSSISKRVRESEWSGAIASSHILARLCALRQLAVVVVLA